MAKSRKYRQVRVNKIQLETLVELGKHIHIGIDVAKTKQVALFQDRETGRGITVKWNHPDETRAFFALCEGLRTRGRSVEIIMEPSGTYGDPFLHWFHTEGFDVQRVLGLQVAAGAAAIDGVRSGHDAKSAHLMVAIHKLDGSHEWHAREDATRELRSVLAMHAWHDDQCQRLVGMAEGALARSWPELGQLLTGRAKTYWRLLERSGGPSGVAHSPEVAANFMRKHGRSLLKSAKISAICDSAATTLGVPMLKAEQEHLKFIGREYMRVLRARDTLAAELEARVRGMAAAELFPFIGTAATAALHAYNLDPLRFDSARAFVKALGLNLKEKSSGEHQGRLCISKRGAPKPRKLLALAAGRLIARDPIVKAWHVAKRSRDGTRKRNGMISVVAVTRKIAAAVWHVARGEAFDAELLFDAKRLARRDPGLQEYLAASKAARAAKKASTEPSGVLVPKPERHSEEIAMESEACGQEEITLDPHAVESASVNFRPGLTLERPFTQVASPQPPGSVRTITDSTGNTSIRSTLRKRLTALVGHISHR